jgi:hypothetical protein
VQTNFCFVLVRVIDMTERSHTVSLSFKTYVTQHHEMSRFAHLRKVMYFVKIDQLRYPDMTTALQTCYNIKGATKPRNENETK